MVWDYQSHNQYLLSLDYFTELLSISSNQSSQKAELLNEFLQAHLVTTEPPAKTNWGWDPLSKIYHVGCQNIYQDEKSTDKQELADAYLEFCEEIDQAPVNLFTSRPGQVIELPAPDLTVLKQPSFFDVLKQRKTSRSFDAMPVTLGQLSCILYASFGLIHGEWEELAENGLKVMGMRKASPASGGLHSEEAYLIAYRVEGLEPGLYHYRPQDHKLSLLRLGQFEQEIIEYNMQQSYSNGMAFGIYISSRFDKIWWKYKHSKAYKITMLDIGHVSQTFLLSATALGLNTWLTGAFKEDKIHEFLSIDGINESVVLFVGAGYGSGQAVPDMILNRIHNS